MMTILLVVFTSLTVVYIMNLLIGLLNIAIEDYNENEKFLLLKAKVFLFNYNCYD